MAQNKSSTQKSNNVKASPGGGANSNILGMKLDDLKLASPLKVGNKDDES